jgi:hypothetical protein
MTAVRVQRGDLAWAIKAVIPHACRDLDLPVLAAVRIEADPDGAVYAVATDRYTFGAAWIPGSRDHDDTPVAAAMLSIPDARELARRMAGEGDQPADLQFYDDGELAVDYRVRFEPWTEEPEYIEWRKLLGQVLRAKPALPAANQGLNPEFLGRFAAGRRPGNTGRALTFMPVSKGATDLVCSVLGEQFAGAIMGVRLTPSSDAPGTPAEFRADWLARTGAAA